MAFAGRKTTVYEAGLKVPFVVRNPYEEKKGVVSDAMLSHVDITPSLLDFAGGLDADTNGPKNYQAPNKFWQERGENLSENRDGGNEFKSYQGKSWVSILGDADAKHHEAIMASHTFHEITMYYPMRVYRDTKYKLIWNIAGKLDYPFASDLWAASSWQAQYQKGEDANYGQKTVGEYIHRPTFELYDIAADPHESENLAEKTEHQATLKSYQSKLKAMQLQARRSVDHEVGLRIDRAVWPLWQLWLIAEKRQRFLLVPCVNLELPFSIEKRCAGIDG